MQVPGEHSTPGTSSSAWIGKVGVPPRTSRGTGSPSPSSRSRSRSVRSMPGRAGLAPVRRGRRRGCGRRRRAGRRGRGSAAGRPARTARRPDRRDRCPVRPMPTSRSTRTGSGRSSPSRPARERAGRVGVVDDRPEGRLRVRADQPGEPGDVRPDERIGEQDVGPARRGDHLGLGDRGALVLADAQRARHPDDLGHLVRLDVRPEPVRPPAPSRSSPRGSAGRGRGRSASDGLRSSERRFEPIT